MATKRLGGMKLSDFSTQSNEPENSQVNEATLAAKTSKKAPASKKKKQAMSTINIEITRKQQRWLLDTAQEVRDNNDQAVPPLQRVYPKHLIGVAIELLQAQDINWTTIKNTEELRKELDLH